MQDISHIEIQIDDDGLYNFCIPTGILEVDEQLKAEFTSFKKQCISMVDDEIFEYEVGNCSLYVIFDDYDLTEIKSKNLESNPLVENILNNFKKAVKAS